MELLGMVNGTTGGLNGTAGVVIQTVDQVFGVQEWSLQVTHLECWNDYLGH